MRNFFHRIWLIWDDLAAEITFGFLVFVLWVVVNLALAVVVTAAISHLDDPNPKPLGKTIYLQPY